ncbi:MAG: peptide deformylase [Candidatus Blackburnbacteria bacterium]|nr:peptide deformylase [Candidatus Blackburnbacteria bacterium]
MVRKILQTTDPKLREKSKPILKADKKLLSLIRDLEETLKAQNDPEGLGLAAPQVGVLSRVFILQNTKD